MSFGDRVQTDEANRPGGTKWYVKCLSQCPSNTDLLAIPSGARFVLILILILGAAFFCRRLCNLVHPKEIDREFFLKSF